MRAKPLIGNAFISTLPLQFSKHANPVYRLGLSLGASVAVPAGTKCYDCGIQGIRAMTPTMAAMNAACREVANSVCDGSGGTGVQGGTTPSSGTSSSGSWSQPTQPVADSRDGPTELIVHVLEASKRKPLRGAKVSVSLAHRGGALLASNVASGETDLSGRYSVVLQAPTLNVDHIYKVKISPGAGQDFPDERADVPARSSMAASAGTRQMDTAKISVTVCPSGVDPLVCEVAQAQELYWNVYNQQIVAWGNSAQAQGVASDNAIAAVSDFVSPTLKKNWDIYATWIGNNEIYPDEWPALIKRFEQMWDVWAQVPWPSGELKDLFIRCAKGIELYKGFTLYNPKLYVDRYSDFWPKKDDHIRRIIAGQALVQMDQIFDCMQHKVEKKARNIERQQKKWQIIGMVVSNFFLGTIFLESIPVVGGLLNEYATKEFTDMLNQSSAEDFSKFMVGYKEFAEDCEKAEEKDFICKYIAPFIMWASEVLLLGDFYDQVAMEVGLPGARPGLTQEDVIEPMAGKMVDAGVDVQAAAITPGGVSKTPNLLTVGAGIGVVGALALLAAMVFKK